MRIHNALTVCAIAASLSSTAFAQETVVTRVQDISTPSTQCLQAQRDAEIRDGVIGGLIGVVAGHSIGHHGGRLGGSLLGGAAGAGGGTWVGAHSQVCAQAANRETVTTEVISTRRCAPVTERYVDPDGVSHSRTVEMCQIASGGWRAT
jgi:uncharacterized protein YcfJ